MVFPAGWEVKVLVRKGRHHPAPRGALEQPRLDEIGFVVIF